MRQVSRGPQAIRLTSAGNLSQSTFLMTCLEVARQAAHWGCGAREGTVCLACSQQAHSPVPTGSTSTDPASHGAEMFLLTMRRLFPGVFSEQGRAAAISVTHGGAWTPGPYVRDLSNSGQGVLRGPGAVTHKCQEGRASDVSPPRTPPSPGCGYRGSQLLRRLRAEDLLQASRAA